MISLDVTALTWLTYAAVPGFAAGRGGWITNIASISGIAPELLNRVYGGAKASVIGLSRSLYHVLSNKGTRIQAVLPGATATEFWKIAGTPAEHLPGEIAMRAEDMVDVALAGFDHGEISTVTSLPNHAE